MKYEFQEKGHKHFLDGKRVTGVTTILGVIAKPALIPWAANMAVDYIKNNEDRAIIERLDQTDNNKKHCGLNLELLEEARTAHRRKKEDAGQKGTDVHAMIEKEVKNAIENTSGFLKAEWKEQYDTPQILHFFDWAVKNKVKFLESEKKVWSEKMFVAGICDFVCEINGEKLVGDLKTSSGIYTEHFYQVAAYRMFLEEMGEKDFKGSVIVNLKKDGKFDEDQDVIINYSYEDERDAFLSALKLYRVGKSFSKNKFSNKL